jgi:hypothetical protein
VKNDYGTEQEDKALNGLEEPLKKTKFIEGIIVVEKLIASFHLPHLLDFFQLVPYIN